MTLVIPKGDRHVITNRQMLEIINNNLIVHILQAHMKENFDQVVKMKGQVEIPLWMNIINLITIFIIFILLKTSSVNFTTPRC